MRNLIAGGLLALVFFGCGRSHSGQLLFENANFEQGTLDNWQAEGEACRHQPVYGDNPVARGRSSAKPEGDYWIGTYEQRHTEAEPAGAVLGDGPLCVIRSTTFKIKAKTIQFRVGGGQGSEATGVLLEVEGQRVLFEPGRAAYTSTEEMFEVQWDVSEYVGKSARVVILDLADDGWGHINADDFRYA